MNATYHNYGFFRDTYIYVPSAIIIGPWFSANISRAIAEVCFRMISSAVMCVYPKLVGTQYVVNSFSALFSFLLMFRISIPKRALRVRLLMSNFNFMKSIPRVLDGEDCDVWYNLDLGEHIFKIRSNSDFFRPVRGGNASSSIESKSNSFPGKLR